MNYNNSILFESDGHTTMNTTSQQKKGTQVIIGDDINMYLHMIYKNIYKIQYTTRDQIADRKRHEM